MDVFEITGFQTGTDKSGVNYLQPSDAFEEIRNGFIHRQVLQSRPGFSRFSTNSLATRVLGIWQWQKSDQTTETLAADTNYLYKYNNGTDTWDQIATAGSLGGAHTFNIDSNEEYISGTGYPDKDGNDRFVFTGMGMTTIYFYDGTDVRDFTSLVDNPDYTEPPEGSIVRAWHVAYYGERLNLFHPTINNGVSDIDYPQHVFFSGIRNAAGNGDKFDVSSAKFVAADTQEYLSGISRVSDSIVMHFSESNWRLDKTTDAFNPYIISKITSTIGTSAPFSPVSWADESTSLGRTGVISTDLRVTQRIDNKIPNYMSDIISQNDFALSYGGYDRENGLFLWNYNPQSDEDDDDALSASYQDEILCYSYEEGSWATWDIRSSVFGQTDDGVNIVWNNINATDHPEKPHWARWDTTTEIWSKIGLGTKQWKTLFGDEKGFIYQLNTDRDDYAFAITAITDDDPAVVTIGSHPFEVGDEVWIYAVEGMTEINNWTPTDPKTVPTPYVVTAADATTITLNVNADDYTPYTSGGIVTKPIEFTARTIPFNPYRDRGRRIYVSHIDFLVETNDGYLLVDIFSDEEADPWKSSVAATESASNKPRKWVTVTVNSEMEFLQMRLKQINPALKLKLTSIRIYAKAGGLSNA